MKISDLGMRSSGMCMFSVLPGTCSRRVPISAGDRKRISLARNSAAASSGTNALNGTRRSARVAATRGSKRSVHAT